MLKERRLEMVNLGWPWLEHEERRAGNGREEESIFGLHERRFLFGA